MRCCKYNRTRVPNKFTEFGKVINNENHRRDGTLLCTTHGRHSLQCWFSRVFLLEQNSPGNGRGILSVTCTHPTIFWGSLRWRIVHTAENLLVWTSQFTEMDRELRQRDMNKTLCSYIHVVITRIENVQQWMLLLTESGHIIHGRHVIFSRSILLSFERL